MTVEASLHIEDVNFTPVYFDESVKLFGVTGLVGLEETNLTSLSNDSSCCLVLLGPDFGPVLASNIIRYFIESYTLYLNIAHAP